MSRPDHSRSTHSRRSSSLSLSTGRFEGRPTASDDVRHTRHNPLRESGRDANGNRRPERTPNNVPSGHRHSGRSQAIYADNERATSQRRSFGRGRERDARHDTSRNFACDSKHNPGRNANHEQHPSEKLRNGILRVASSLVGLLVSLIPFTTKTGGDDSSHRSIDLRRLALRLVAFAVAIVFVMAIAHVGPFAPLPVDSTSQPSAIPASSPSTGATTS